MKLPVLALFPAFGFLCLGAVEVPAPNRFEPLPAGSITAEGWLGLQLEQMTEGLVGRLQEHSRFLAPENAWLSRTGTLGWEEQAYWLRSFAKLAILTRSPRLLKDTERWMDGLAANADPDGDDGCRGRLQVEARPRNDAPQEPSGLLHDALIPSATKTGSDLDFPPDGGTDEKAFPRSDSSFVWD